MQAATPQAEAAGFTGRARRALLFPDRNNWGPRGGIAWRPFGGTSTVARLGYGVTFSSYGNIRNMPSLLPPLNGFQKRQGLLFLSNPFPPVESNSLDGWALADNYVNAYIQQWNATVQHRLPRGAALEVGYVANKGTHLDGAFRILNQAFPGFGPPESRRPYPGFGVYETADSSVSSIYHSLQAKAEKHFRGGLFLLASYTWSKSIDTGAGPGDVLAGGEVTDWQNGNAPDERGLSLFDVRHRLALSWIYELPFARGNRWLGRWQVNGIVFYQSGFPATPLTGAPLSGSDVGSIGSADRPNRIKDGNLAKSQRRPERWFDTSAFVPNNPGQFGNSGRGILIADGMDNWDLALYRDFSIGEGRKLQFRWEMYNALNQVNFGFPDAQVVSPTFGRVSTAGVARQIQVGLKYTF